VAEIKLALYLVQLAGLYTYIWAIVVSFGDVKAWILFFVGLVFAGYKVYNIHLDVLKKNLIWRNTKEKR
jgi:hypothetical protein